MSYHVDVIPNRNSPPAILFRHAKREQTHPPPTLANLSKLPPEIVDGIRALLKGGQVSTPWTTPSPFAAPCPTAMSPLSSASPANSV